MSTKPYEWNTLLVEDSEDDAFIIQRAFKTAGISSKITCCNDGVEAIHYLEGEIPYADRNESPLPHLVLLDLKIPLRNGLEVLRWMREQEQFKSLVVIMLTASSAKKDIQEAYALNVNAYLMKPSTLNEMTELARSIRTCWLEPLEALFERAAPAATTQHSH